MCEEMNLHKIEFNGNPQRTNTLALTALLCGSENWTCKERDARRITAVEMKHI
jgi:hypothetical protein